MNMMLRMDISNKAWQRYIQDVSPPTLRIFKHFLITNSVFKKYFQNFVTYTRTHVGTTAGRGENLISFAFYWPDTPQGPSLWGNLSVKWKQMFNDTHK